MKKKVTFTTRGNIIVTRENICIFTKDLRWEKITRRFAALYVNSPLNFTILFLTWTCHDASFLKIKNRQLHKKFQGEV